MEGEHSLCDIIYTLFRGCSAVPIIVPPDAASSACFSLKDPLYKDMHPINPQW